MPRRRATARRRRERDFICIRGSGIKHQGSKGRNAENHAIALVLGRLYMYALVKNIPDDTVAGILVLFRLAGVDVGQKHHNRQAISSFAGIAASMCIEGVAKAFADKPKNLLRSHWLWS